ncbi:hypothetical protein IFR05_016167 [Cadophora sp. M221]|nr:hypothetical protein IFR05_016167 [Cadophora sp. M221]
MAPTSASTTIDHGETSEMSYATKFVNDKDVIWYKKNIDHKVTPEVREMLEEYSGISANEVLQHVHKIVRNLLPIPHPTKQTKKDSDPPRHHRETKHGPSRTYPCTGLGIWLTPMISHQEIYTSILARLKNGAALLDKLYGVDIASHWDVGFEMFRDGSKFYGKFIECDILTPNKELTALEGSFDVIYIAQVLHQWGWDVQVAALKELVRLSKPKKNTIVFGFQLGQVRGGVKVLETAKSRATYFWHDEETFKELWRQVGEETGTKWVADATLKSWEEGGLDPKDTAYLGPDTRFLGFVVRRLDEGE